MIKIKRSNKLVLFAKSTCANWYEDYCTMTSGKCKLSNDNPCGYFEKAVLKNANPDYPYSDHNEHKNYNRYVMLYSKCNPKYAGKTTDTNQRKCSCGNSIKSRQRMCDICRKRSRKATYYKNRQLSDMTRNN